MIPLNAGTVSFGFLSLLFLLWMKRGRKSPHIDRYTTRSTMGFRSVITVFSGIALLVLIFYVAGALIGYPMDGPPDPAKQEAARLFAESIVGSPETRPAGIGVAFALLVFVAAVGLAFFVGSWSI